jgi:hypothetical protein
MRCPLVFSIGANKKATTLTIMGLPRQTDPIILRSCEDV